MDNKHWRNRWQHELAFALDYYQAYRDRNRCFFCTLLIFFFLVNTFCYWLAIMVSFPELIAEQPVRMIKIQQPVALLGGLFDSLSFFITVWLIQHAITMKTGFKFIGILSVDLIIAAIATAWVLLVVMFSSWLIGPPQNTESVLNQSNMQITISESLISNTELTAETEQAETNGLTEISESIPTNTEVTNTAIIPEVTSTVAIVTAEEFLVAQSLSSQDSDLPSQDTEAFQSGFYQDMLIRALKNPMANINYFLFGLCMGLSTLLPTGFHLYLAIKSLRNTK